MWKVIHQTNFRGNQKKIFGGFWSLNHQPQLQSDEKTLLRVFQSYRMFFFRFLPSYFGFWDNDCFSRKKPRFSEFWPLMISGDLIIDLSKKSIEIIFVMIFDELSNTFSVCLSVSWEPSERGGGRRPPIGWWKIQRPISPRVKKGEVNLTVNWAYRYRLGWTWAWVSERFTCLLSWFIKTRKRLAIECHWHALGHLHRAHTEINSN